MKLGLENELNQNVKLLKYDEALGLIIGTVEGLYVTPLINSEFIFTETYTLVESLNIWDHQNTPQGEFIATEHGLYQIDRASRSATNILALNKSIFNTTQSNITALELDQNNVLWMATHNGAYYWSLDSLKFENFQLRGSEFLNNTVWSIYQLADNSILYGTDNGLVHLNKLEAKPEAKFYFQSRNKKDAYGNNAVFDIYQLEKSSNIVYMNTAQGLKTFNFKTKEIQSPIVVTSTIENPFESLNYASAPFGNNQIVFMGESDYYIYNTQNNLFNF